MLLKIWPNFTSLFFKRKMLCACTKLFSLIGEPISYIKGQGCQSFNQSYLELVNKNSDCYSIQSNTAINGGELLLRSGNFH